MILKQKHEGESLLWGKFYNVVTFFLWGKTILEEKLALQQGTERGISCEVNDILVMTFGFTDNKTDLDILCRKEVWNHVNCHDVLAVPDKWEFPWVWPCYF